MRPVQKIFLGIPLPVPMRAAYPPAPAAVTNITIGTPSIGEKCFNLRTHNRNRSNSAYSSPLESSRELPHYGWLSPNGILTPFESVDGAGDAVFLQGQLNQQNIGRIVFNQRDLYWLILHFHFPTPAS